MGTELRFRRWLWVPVDMTACWCSLSTSTTPSSRGQPRLVLPTPAVVAALWTVSRFAAHHVEVIRYVIVPHLSVAITPLCHNQRFGLLGYSSAFSFCYLRQHVITFLVYPQSLHLSLWSLVAPLVSAL